MNKNCSTCTYWKRYIRHENKCVCQIQFRLFQDVFTNANDSCDGWKKYKPISQRILKAIEKHHKQYPQIEDLY